MMTIKPSNQIQQLDIRTVRKHIALVLQSNDTV